MQSKLFYSQLFGLLLLFLLLLLVVPRYTQIIPHELKNRVENTLAEENLSWVSVRVENRDIVLNGMSPTFEAHLKAVEVAERVQGIRSIEDSITPVLISPYRMDIKYDGEKIVLKGYMPSEKRKDKLLVKVRTLYGDNFVDEIKIGAGEPKFWDAFISTVTKEVKAFEISSVNIRDTELHASGKIGKEEVRSKVEKNLKSFSPKGFNIHCHMIALDASAKVCQEKFNHLLAKEKIKFPSNKALIDESNHKLLEELSDVSLLCPNLNIEIIGHTDSLGDDVKNTELSLKRAKAVAAKLFSLGIPLSRLDAVGMGEKFPLANNETKEGRAKNRRIEFKVIESKGE